MPAEQVISHPVDGTPWSVRSRLLAGDDRPTLVLLHGFTGSSEDFHPLVNKFGDRVNWLAIDLPGHGRSIPADCSLLTVLRGIQSVLTLVPDPSKSFLLGYSMGARIALQYLVKHPQQRGILISGSPGLRTQEQRELRRQTDSVWIRKLNDPTYDIEDFCYDWEQQPIICSQLRIAEPLCSKIAGGRRTNNKAGLAEALQLLGTGALPSLWSRLAGLPGHQLIVGEQDAKFVQIAESMRQENPRFRLSSIPDSGHAPHLEQPDATADAILNYLHEVDFH